MADSPNPPYPPYPPFPPYPPYPPVVVMVPCCCRCGMTPPANGAAGQTGTATQPSGSTQVGVIAQPGGTTQPSGTTQTNTFDTIALTIVPSGADDGIGGIGNGGLSGLGADSALTATLYQAGASSTPFQSISLKTSSQPAWTVFVPQTTTVSLSSPVSASSLGSASIALIPGTDSPNTLAIQSIQVVISNSGGTPAPVMLLNQTGSPLQNLTGMHASATFPL